VGGKGRRERRASLFIRQMSFYCRELYDYEKQVSSLPCRPSLHLLNRSAKPIGAKMSRHMSVENHVTRKNTVFTRPRDHVAHGPEQAFAHIVQ
jgi:hypothetical protein